MSRLAGLSVLLIHRAPLAVMVGALALTGCRVRPEAPERTADHQEPPAVAESTVAIPVRIPLAVVQAAVESAVPPGYEIHKAGDKTITVRISKFPKIEINHVLHWWADGSIARGPIAIAGEGRSLTATTDCNGSLTGRFEVFKGADVRETLSVEVGIGVRVTPSVTPDWRLNAQVDPILQVRRAEFSVAGFDISVRDHVDSALRPHLDKAAVSANAAISALAIADPVRGVWSSLTEPRQVTIPSAPPVWVSIVPSAILAPTLHADASGLTVLVGAKARIAMRVGSRPAAQDPGPLPAPDTSAWAPGLALEAPIALSYDTMAHEARTAFQDEVYPLSGGILLRITDVKLYSLGERLVVGAYVDADVPWSFWNTKGWIYFWGTPVVTPADKRIDVTQFDYHEQTRSYLLKVADWLLHDTVRDAMQRKLRWDLTKPYAQATTMANALLADFRWREDLVVRGSVSEVGVTHLSPGNDDLRVGVVVKGQLTLEASAIPPIQ